MPTIYYRHQRTDKPCVHFINHVFYIPNSYQVDDWVYLIIVFKGEAFAGRRISTVNVQGCNKLECVPFSDEVTGKQILLKHYLQGN